MSMQELKSSDMNSTIRSLLSLMFLVRTYFCWEDFLTLRLLTFFSTTLLLVFLKCTVDSNFLRLILTIPGCLSEDLT